MEYDKIQSVIIIYKILCFFFQFDSKVQIFLHAPKHTQRYNILKLKFHKYR